MNKLRTLSFLVVLLLALPAAAQTPTPAPTPAPTPTPTLNCSSLVESKQGIVMAKEYLLVAKTETVGFNVGMLLGNQRQTLIITFTALSPYCFKDKTTALLTFTDKSSVTLVSREAPNCQGSLSFWFDKEQNNLADLKTLATKTPASIAVVTTKGPFRQAFDAKTGTAFMQTLHCLSGLLKQ